MNSNWHLTLAFLLLLAGTGSCDSCGYFDSFSAWFQNRCSSCEVPKNFELMEVNLKKYLFGQPLASDILNSALQGHLAERNPKKALAISLHGSTGVGKNFVVQLVLDAIFREGARSEYVKIFVRERDFPFARFVEKYKEKVIQTIESTVKKCARSFFIFDESSEMPRGVLDVVKPYLDFHESLGGVDYRKSVFIFLNNLGALEIDKMTLELNLKNIERDAFQLKPFQDMLHNLSVRDNKWALFISKHLIDFFVPFLPLERHHVKQCAKTELRRYGYKFGAELNEDSDHIVDEMEYVPKDHKKYSSSGCKRVAQLAKGLAIKRAFKNKNEL